jgi:hypothetical protein
MKNRLTAKDYRFDALFETIVASPQFLNKREPEAPRTLDAGLLYRKVKQ